VSVIIFEMKKVILFSWLIITFIFFHSCSKNNEDIKADDLSTEKAIIQHFIKLQGIVVLDDYPKNQNFGENEYYLADKGLYFQVIDSGNGIRASMHSEVSVRLEYSINVNQYVKGNNDTIRITNSQFPYIFAYGLKNSYEYSNSVCEGFSIPLDYVSERATINLIIPSNLGILNDRDNKVVRFYKNLTYTRFN